MRRVGGIRLHLGPAWVLNGGVECAAYQSIAAHVQSESESLELKSDETGRMQYLIDM